MKVKSILSIIATFVICSFSLLSCGVAETTEVSFDKLPGKIVVSGIVKSTDVTVNVNTPVKINYKIGESYHQMVIYTNNQGVFYTEIGCTPNSSVEIVASATIINDQNTIYYGTAKSTIVDGNGAKIEINLRKTELN